MMPDAFHRFLAYPNSIAMIGLGVSLWLSQRQSSDTTRLTAEARPEYAAV